MTQAQREFLLRKQMQAIQDELGEQNPEKAELEELRKRLVTAKVKGLKPLVSGFPMAG